MRFVFLLYLLAALCLASTQSSTECVSAIANLRLLTQKQLDGRIASFIDSRFHEFDLTDFSYAPIGKGSTSQVIAIGPYVVMLPITGEIDRVRKSYQKITEVYANLKRLSPERLRGFPSLVESHLNFDFASATGIPALIFERASLGTLQANLQNPEVAGPKADFANLKRTLVEIARSVESLHMAGYSHGDIKPENIYVTNSRGRGVEILLGDLGGVGTAQEHSLTITRSYMPAPNSPFYSAALMDTPEGRDAWALRKVFQASLLGTPIYRLGTDAVSREAMFPQPGNTTETEEENPNQTYELRRSPHSIRPEIPETLSAVAWVPVGYISDYTRGLEMASRYENLGYRDRFFSEWLGPKVLSKLPPEKLAAVIFYADELRNRFDGNHLNLSPSMYQRLRPLIAELAAKEHGLDNSPRSLVPTHPEAPTVTLPLPKP